MNKYLKLLMVVLALALLPVAVAAETPAPGGPFNTAFRIQNLGTEAATCTFGFYDANGTTQFSSGSLAPIGVGESLLVYVPDLAVDPGMYSGVVSCSQEVAAVVNYSDSNSGASYSGVSGSEVATTLYAPGIYDNYYGYYSNVVVQNASSAVIDIDVEIYASGNPTPVATQSATDVEANGFAYFEQEGLAQLATNQFYSAKIVGTGQVAAVVNIYGRGGVAEQLYSYNPFASGSTTAYAPVILNSYYGYNSALIIQNLGTSNADVTITYTDGTEKTTTIAPGAADSRYTPAEGIPSGANGLWGAEVECTNGQPIVVLVNESTGMNRAASYSGFASGARTVSAPIVMKRYYFYNTSITCQNIGTGPADLSVSYSGVSVATSYDNVPVNSTQLIYQPGESSLSNNWIGSATITSDQDIVCVVNEDMNEAPQVSQSMDQLYAYNAIGQ
jgi:hypothetical protein